MSEPKQPEAESLTDYRLSQLERAVTKLVEQNSQMIALEQRHLDTREALERAFKAIKDNDIRIRAIETDLPTMRLVRGWVITGVLAVMAASGTVVVKSIATVPPAVATQPARTG
ncbi:hypothetical protein ACUXAV_000322 [Cupriavidus metallidurans]|uniref:hypothetical protein n=1 Tax=Cupriavidus metallidurans TaxID=119219 RepID=UPI000493224F|nr:hypothetical protein [Cupriavidus metallidurans]MDE4918283.1 hypothetical protein [Cupriavidus metallidurans]